MLVVLLLRLLYICKGIAGSQKILLNHLGI